MHETAVVVAAAAAAAVAAAAAAAAAVAAAAAAEVVAAAADCFQACGTAAHAVPLPVSRELTRAEEVARQRQELRGGDVARGWMVVVQMTARRAMLMIWIAEDFAETR